MSSSVLERASALAMSDLEVKGVVRHIRTLKGVAKFGGRIGDLITDDGAADPKTGKLRRDAKPQGGKAPAPKAKAPAPKAPSTPAARPTGKLPPPTRKGLHQIRLPDGTMAERTSKSRKYTHAVVTRQDNRVRAERLRKIATDQQEAIDAYAEARRTGDFSKFKKVPSGRSYNDEKAGRKPTNLAYRGGAANEYGSEMHFHNPDPADDSNRDTELMSVSDEKEGIKNPVDRAKYWSDRQAEYNQDHVNRVKNEAAGLDAGPAETYFVPRWSSSRSLASSAMGSRDVPSGPEFSSRVVEVGTDMGGAQETGARVQGVRRRVAATEAATIAAAPPAKAKPDVVTDEMIRRSSKKKPLAPPAIQLHPGKTSVDWRDRSMDEDEAAEAADDYARSVGFKKGRAKWDNFEVWIGPDGQRYDFGYDDPEEDERATGKLIVTRQGEWDILASGDDWQETFYDFMKWDADTRAERQGAREIARLPRKKKETDVVPATPVTAENLEAQVAKLKEPPKLTAFEQRQAARELPVTAPSTQAATWSVTGLEGHYGLPVSERMMARSKLKNDLTVRKLELAISDPSKRQQVPKLYEQLQKELAQAGVGENEHPRPGLRKWFGEHFTPVTSSTSAPSVLKAQAAVTPAGTVLPPRNVMPEAPARPAAWMDLDDASRNLLSGIRSYVTKKSMSSKGGRIHNGTIDQLEAWGFIAPSPDNKRRYVITPEGQAFMPDYLRTEQPTPSSKPAPKTTSDVMLEGLTPESQALIASLTAEPAMPMLTVHRDLQEALALSAGGRVIQQRAKEVEGMSREDAITAYQEIRGLALNQQTRDAITTAIDRLKAGAPSRQVQTGGELESLRAKLTAARTRRQNSTSGPLGRNLHKNKTERELERRIAELERQRGKVPAGEGAGTVATPELETPEPPGVSGPVWSPVETVDLPFTPGEILRHETRGEVTYIGRDAMAGALRGTPHEPHWVRFEDETEGMVTLSFLSRPARTVKVTGEEANIIAMSRGSSPSLAEAEANGMSLSKINLSVPPAADPAFRRFLDEQAQIATDALSNAARNDVPISRAEGNQHRAALSLRRKYGYVPVGAQATRAASTPSPVPLMVPTTATAPPQKAGPRPKLSAPSIPDPQVPKPPPFPRRYLGEDAAVLDAKNKVSDWRVELQEYLSKPESGPYPANTRAPDVVKARKNLEKWEAWIADYEAREDRILALLVRGDADERIEAAQNPIEHPRYGTQAQHDIADVELRERQKKAVARRRNRVKQASVDAQFAADLEQQINESRGDPDAIRDLVEYHADPKRDDFASTRTTLSRDVVAMVRRGETDPDKLIETLRGTAISHGLIPGTPIGSEVLFDQTFHRPMSGSIKPPARVRIVSPGYDFRYTPSPEDATLNWEKLGFRSDLEHISTAVVDEIDAPETVTPRVTPVGVFTAQGLQIPDEFPEKMPKPRTGRKKKLGKKLSFGEFSAMDRALEAGAGGITAWQIGSEYRAGVLVDHGYLEEVSPGRYAATDKGRKAHARRVKQVIEQRGAQTTRDPFEFPEEHAEEIAAASRAYEREHGIARFDWEGSAAAGIPQVASESQALSNPAAFINEQARQMFKGNQARLDYVKRIAANVRNGEWTLQQARDTIMARGQRENDPKLIALANMVSSAINLGAANRSAAKKKRGAKDMASDLMFKSLFYKGAGEDKQTGAMIALVPSIRDAVRLAIPHGEDPNELHATLMYLGDADAFDGYTKERIIQSVRNAAAGMRAINGKPFSASVFNPKGKEPCIVLGISGRELEIAHDVVEEGLRHDTLVSPPPTAHKPWIPHITLIYTNHVDYYMEDAIDRTGDEVTFDRIRVAFAGDTEDIQLGPKHVANLNDRLSMILGVHYKAFAFSDTHYPEERVGPAAIPLRKRPKRPGSGIAEEFIGDAETIQQIGTAPSGRSTTGETREEARRSRVRQRTRKPTRAGLVMSERSKRPYPTARMRSMRPTRPIALPRIGDEFKDVIRTAAGMARFGGDIGDEITLDMRRRSDSRRGKLTVEDIPESREVTPSAPTTARKKIGDLTRLAGAKRVRKMSLDAPTADPAIKEAIRETYEGSFADFETKVKWDKSYVEEDKEDGKGPRVRVEGVITKNGDEAGFFVRIVYPRLGKVDNASIDLDTEFQGQRFADQFYSHSEAQLHEHGISTVELTANGEVGGYAWARRGFDWDLQYARITFDGMAERIESILENGTPHMQKDARDGSWTAFSEDYADFKPMKLTIEEKQRLKTWKAAFEHAATTGDMRGIPTPAEMAAYGETGKKYPRFSAFGREYESWVGKDLMLGSSWKGHKDIEPEDRELKYDSPSMYMKRVRACYGQEEKDWKVDDYLHIQGANKDALNMFSADVFMREGAYEEKGVGKPLPKTQKCKYCKEQATKRIIHSEGIAYIPVCDAHLAKGKKAASESVPYGGSDPSNIDEVRDIKSRLADITEFKLGRRRVKKMLRRAAARVRDPNYWRLPVGRLIERRERTPQGHKLKPGTIRFDAVPQRPRGARLPTRGVLGTIKLPPMEADESGKRWTILDKPDEPWAIVKSGKGKFRIEHSGKNLPDSFGSWDDAQRTLAELLDKVALRAHRKAKRESKAITPGGRVGDPSSRNVSPRENWVEKRGGMPRYMKFVRNALMRERGMSTGKATAMAVNAIKRWARGQGNVSPKVRAAAVKALAQWEAMKASS